MINVADSGSDAQTMENTADGSGGIGTRTGATEGVAVDDEVIGGLRVTALLGRGARVPALSGDHWLTWVFVLRHAVSGV
jgi:hypothetical protein